MGIFDSFKKTLSGEKDPPKEQAPVREETVPAGPKIAAMARDEKADFKLLISLFQGHKVGQDIDFAAFVRKVNPEATPHKCPHCGVVHEFKASRARKCPACSEKMVVRQGLFITEDQAKEIEKDTQDFYEKQGVVSRAGFSLEAAQDYKVRKQRAEYLHALAEAFRYMAQVGNQKDSNGYSFWDKAWGYYNEARIEEMKELRQDMMQYSRLPDIFWDMTQMLLDQAKSETKEDRAVKGKRQALTQACMTLAEAAKLGADPYFITDVYALAKKQINELSVTDDDFKNIATDVATRMRLDGSALKKYEGWMRELIEYQVIDRF